MAFGLSALKDEEVVNAIQSGREGEGQQASHEEGSRRAKARLGRAGTCPSDRSVLC